MTAGPAQTPMVLLEAGGMAMFSLECQKALIRAGYDPDAFGTYDQVKGKIDKAKAACDEYEKLPPAERADPAKKPSPSVVFLSQCQSGHLSQDALFRKQGGRDSPCDNHPGSEGNVTGLAPCMPHFGASNAVGSIHQRITVQEPRSAREQGTPGTPLNADQVADCAKKTSDIALGGMTEPKPTDPPEKLLTDAEKLKEQRGGRTDKAAQDLMEKERQSRQAGSSALQQASAADLAAKKGVDVNDGTSQEDSNKKAAECIEAFRKAGMDAMRKQVVGENSTANKKAAQQKAAAAVEEAQGEKKAAQSDAAAAQKKKEEAEARAKAAQDELDKHGPLKRDQKAKDLRAARDAAKADASAAGQEQAGAERRGREADGKLEKAEKAKTEADRRLAPPPPPGGMSQDEQCLQSQADILEKKLPNLPEMTGQVPAPKPEDTGDDQSGTGDTTQPE